MAQDYNFKKCFFFDDLERSYRFVSRSELNVYKNQPLQEATFPTERESEGAIVDGEINVLFTILTSQIQKSKKRNYRKSIEEQDVPDLYIRFSCDKDVVSQDFENNLIGITGGTAWVEVCLPKQAKSTWLGEYTQKFSIPTPQSSNSEITFSNKSIKAVCIQSLEKLGGPHTKSPKKAIILLEFKPMY